jgi:hypothetical protein
MDGNIPSIFSFVFINFLVVSLVDVHGGAAGGTGAEKTCCSRC